MRGVEGGRGREEGTGLFKGFRYGVLWHTNLPGHDMGDIAPLEQLFVDPIYFPAIQPQEISKIRAVRLQANLQTLRMLPNTKPIGISSKPWTKAIQQSGRILKYQDPSTFHLRSLVLLHALPSTLPSHSTLHQIQMITAKRHRLRLLFQHCHQLFRNGNRPPSSIPITNIQRPALMDTVPTLDEFFHVLLQHVKEVAIAGGVEEPILVGFLLSRFKVVVPILPDACAVDDCEELRIRGPLLAWTTEGLAETIDVQVQLARDRRGVSATEGLGGVVGVILVSTSSSGLRRLPFNLKLTCVTKGNSTRRWATRGSHGPEAVGTTGSGITVSNRLLSWRRRW